MHFLSVSNLFSAPQHGSFQLSNINFKQRQFQKIALAGETGSGKTTLLKIIAGLIQPARGEILMESEKLRGPDWQLVAGHKGVAYLSQHFELRNNYRIEELLLYVNELPVNESERLYKICRISPLMKRRSDELSGGEKQRIALAILLVSKPKLLLLDEPFSNLDLIHKKILKAVLNDISEQLYITCVMASHEPEDILSWADEVIILQEGKIIQQDTPTRIYRAPASEYAGGLFGDYNLLKKADRHLLSDMHVGKEMNGDIFFRPEDIMISKDSCGISGKIISSKFLGNHYQTTVDVKGILLKTSSSSEFQKGQNVFICVAKTQEK